MSRPLDLRPLAALADGAVADQVEPVASQVVVVGAYPYRGQLDSVRHA